MATVYAVLYWGAIVYVGGASMALYLRLAQVKFFYGEIHSCLDARWHLKESIRAIWLWVHPSQLLHYLLGLAYMFYEAGRDRSFRPFNPMNTLGALRYLRDWRMDRAAKR